SQPAHSLPPGWTHTGRVNPSHEVQLTFALHQQGTGHLAWLVNAVSDPHSPRYGQHLSLEQVRNLVQPSPATLMAVLKWLQGHGVEKCRSVMTLDFLECRMPASQERAACVPGPGVGGEAQLVIWGSGNKVCISGAWCLGQPRTSSCVLWDCRVPTGGLGIELQGTLQRQSSGSVCPNSGCFSCLLAHQWVGCTGAERKVVSRAWAKKETESGQDYGGRAAFHLGVTPSIIRRHESQEPFLAWLLLLSNMSSLPWVHSVSYGDDEDSLSLAYMERVNVEFMKAAARGLTILFASGDDGAGCRRVPGGNHTFRPSFPASSPYVTTVGGTSFKNPFLVTAEVTDYISGGGFSNVFPMPDYQVR
ncbi:Tripeptidyl-peptidase 1, partial [Phalacrocorax carbo]